MSQPKVIQKSPFVGPQRLWDALDAAIDHGRALGEPAPLERRASIPAGDAAAASPVSALSRLDECTLDANQRYQAGWTLKKTEACGYVSIVLVEDLEHDLWHAGKKKTPKSGGERTEDDQRRLAAAAARRARGNMSWKLRILRADRLWTLTKRGRISTRAEAWARWGEFERVMSRRFPWFKTVVVIEAHKLDGFHIHFAVNRWMPVDSIRLIWHRVLTGERLRSPLRGVDAPGNVDVEFRPLSMKKLCSYMGKYLGKGFDSAEELGVRFKRYAASKGIEAPTITRRRMASTSEGVAGIAVRLRAWLTYDGYIPSDLYELECVPGRRALWMCGEKPSS